MVKSHHVKVTVKEEKGIKDICVFAVKLYVKAWFSDPACFSSEEALWVYRKGPCYCICCSEKFFGHLLNLYEELVALAFFDNKVAVETKNKMVMVLQNTRDSHPENRSTVD